MKRDVMKLSLTLAALCAGVSLPAGSACGTETVVSLEDATLPTTGDEVGFFRGPDAAGYSVYSEMGDWGTTATTGQLQSGPVRFSNRYSKSRHLVTDFTYTAWDGWAFSNWTDTTTPGFGNQYSAVTGQGRNGSANYAVACEDIYGGTRPAITLPLGSTLSSVWLTNTTYAYQSMLNGDQFAKKFGGDTGDDPDWFLLTIIGKSLTGTELGRKELYLADYRGTNDYILDTWTQVDLSSLGAGVRQLEFTFTSSDNFYGMMNTPAYVALDDLTLTPGTQKVWTGGGGTAGADLGNPANWQGGAPSPGDPLLFDSASSSTPYNGLEGANFSEISFSAHAGALTLTGNPLQLTGALVNDSGHAQAINLPLQINHVTSDDDAGVVNTATADIVVHSPISGDATLRKYGPAKLVLANANTYTGGTAVYEGTLEIGKLDSLLTGSSLTIEAGGTVVLASGLSSAGGAASQSAVSTSAGAAVPEPGTLMLLAAAGIVALACWMRRR
jgi:autotransporter-associated beta strand protein